METIDFKDLDLSNPMLGNYLSLGWDVESGYTLTVWAEPLGSARNVPVHHTVLPKALGDAIKNYLTTGINELL
jgi:hypothetical protein